MPGPNAARWLLTINAIVGGIEGAGLVLLPAGFLAILLAAVGGLGNLLVLGFVIVPAAFAAAYLLLLRLRAEAQAWRVSDRAGSRRQGQRGPPRARTARRSGGGRRWRRGCDP